MVDQQQGDQGEGFGFVGHQGGHELREPDRLLQQLLVFRFAGGGVAAGEGQVDHREDAGEPLGQQVIGGDGEADPGVADLAFGAHEPLGQCRLGDQEGPGDPGGQADHGLQREGDPRFLCQSRVAAGEEEAEPLVAEAEQAFFAEIHDRLLRLPGELGPAGSGAAEPVDRAVAGRGQQPGHRVVRWLVVPGAQGERARVLQRVFGEFEVA